MNHRGVGREVAPREHGTGVLEIEDDVMPSAMEGVLHGRVGLDAVARADVVVELAGPRQRVVAPGAAEPERPVGAIRGYEANRRLALRVGCQYTR